MRMANALIWIPVLLLVCWTGSALAQMGGMGRRLYDPATEVTVKGTIEKVTETAGGPGWGSDGLVYTSDAADQRAHAELW